MVPPPAEPRRAAPRFERLRALGIAAPRPHLGYVWPRTPPDGLHQVLPVRRWKVAIAVAAVLFAVMCIPLVSLGVPRLDARAGLFNFGNSLFQCFWLLGWSVGAALPGLALVVLLLGREVVLARPGLLHLRMEVMGFGLGADYPAAEVRNLRQGEGAAGAGTAWRGAHLVFDYHDVPVQFGCDLGPATASALRLELQQVLARPAPADFRLTAAPAIAPRTPASQDSARATLPASPPSKVAVLGLVVANLLPLIGVLACDWQIGEIMLVYWAESVIIGLINIAKLIVIGRWAAAFYAPFFLGHYGAFMAGHLMFLYMFFLRGAQHTGNIEVSEVVASVAALWPTLLGLTISHLLSFAQNFIGRGEYTRTTLAAQMNAPYKRVFVMQFTIIIGGMLTIALGSSLPALVLLIALKLLMDVNAHRGERQRGLADIADEA